MKIAVVADTHGNYHALDAALADIRSEKPDRIVAAGDMINSFPGSREVWNRLQAEDVLYVRGNNEQSILDYGHADAMDPIRVSPRFMPVQYTAESFSEPERASMEKLPLNVTLPGPDGDGVLICHASPFNVWKSLSDDVDENLEAWRNKLLFLCGSKCGRCCDSYCGFLICLVCDVNPETISTESKFGLDFVTVCIFLYP